MESSFTISQNNMRKREIVEYEAFYASFFYIEKKMILRYNNSVNMKGAFMFGILRNVTRGGGII